MNELPINQVVCGDNREIMAQWPDDCIDMIITSPPYWSKRNYGEKAISIWGGDKNCDHEWSKEFCIKCGAWRGQLGLEPDFDLYIEHLLEIIAEFKRILKPTGSFYLNIGDTYSTSGSTGTSEEAIKRHKQFGKNINPSIAIKGHRAKNIPAKCLCGIPTRIRDKMVDEQGWRNVNEIIWQKSNAKPESAENRLTNTYEFILHFVKSDKPIFWTNSYRAKTVAKKPKGGIENIDWEWRRRIVSGKEKEIKVTLWKGSDYYYDLYAIRKPYKDSALSRAKYKLTPYNPTGNGLIPMSGAIKTGVKTKKQISLNPAGKNPGDIIRFPTVYEDWHSLLMIMSNFIGPEQSIKIMDAYFDKLSIPGDIFTIATQSFHGAHFAIFPEKICEDPIKSSCPQWICKECGLPRMRIVKGESIKWSNCGCGAGWKPGIMLDPFCGSGRALIMAKKLGRDYIGIDIVPEYCDMSKRGLENVKVSVSA